MIQPHLLQSKGERGKPVQQKVQRMIQGDITIKAPPAVEKC